MSGRSEPLAPHPQWASSQDAASASTEDTGGGKRASWHSPSLRPQAARREWARSPKPHRCAWHLLKGCARQSPALCPAGAHASRVHAHPGVCPRKLICLRTAPLGVCTPHPAAPGLPIIPTLICLLRHVTLPGHLCSWHLEAQKRCLMDHSSQQGLSSESTPFPSPAQVSAPTVGEGPAPPQPLLRPGCLFVFLGFFKHNIIVFYNIIDFFF